MACERQCHRCAVPQHVRPDALLREEHIDELTLRVEDGRFIDTVRQVQQDPSHAVLAHLDLRPQRSIAEQRLFNKEHAALQGAAGQQVLRALKHQIPTEMRDHDEIAPRVDAPFRPQRNGSAQIYSRGCAP